MAANTGAAFSRGDLVREVRELKDRVKELETRRDLPHASYGSGGPRTRGGRFLAEDLGGERVFEVTTEPPDIFMRPELIATVAAQVIGESVFYDVTSISGKRDTHDVFGELDIGGTSTPSPGPELNFTVKTDRFIAIWGAHTQVEVTGSGTATQNEGYMDLQVDGPTTFDPPAVPTVSLGAYHLNWNTDLAAGTLDITSASVSTSRRFDVEPGDYTVTALYREDDHGDPIGTITWRQRFLLIIAF